VNTPDRAKKEVLPPPPESSSFKIVVPSERATVADRFVEVSGKCDSGNVYVEGTGVSQVAISACSNGKFKAFVQLTEQQGSKALSVRQKNDRLEQFGLQSSITFDSSVAGCYNALGRLLNGQSHCDDTIPKAWLSLSGNGDSENFNSSSSPNVVSVAQGLTIAREGNDLIYNLNGKRLALSFAEHSGAQFFRHSNGKLSEAAAYCAARGQRLPTNQEVFDFCRASITSWSSASPCHNQQFWSVTAHAANLSLAFRFNGQLGGLYAVGRNSTPDTGVRCVIAR